MIPINKFEDLPIFESSQFQFVNTSPLNSELITLTNNLKFQEFPEPYVSKKQVLLVLNCYH